MSGLRCPVQESQPNAQIQVSAWTQSISFSVQASSMTEKRNEIWFPIHITHSLPFCASHWQTDGWRAAWWRRRGHQAAVDTRWDASLTCCFFTGNYSSREPIDLSVIGFEGNGQHAQIPWNLSNNLENISHADMLMCEVALENLLDVSRSWRKKINWEIGFGAKFLLIWPHFCSICSVLHQQEATVQMPTMFLIWNVLFLDFIFVKNGITSCFGVPMFSIAFIRDVTLHTRG